MGRFSGDARHALMREDGVDPKVVADLMGQDLNVNVNICTQTPVESRLQER